MPSQGRHVFCETCGDCLTCEPDHICRNVPLIKTSIRGDALERALARQQRWYDRNRDAPRS